nr:protein FAM47A-like [Procambarus clarkii]
MTQHPGEEQRLARITFMCESPSSELFNTGHGYKDVFLRLSSAKLRPNPVLQSSAKLRPSPVLQSSAKLRPTPVLQSSAKLRPSPVLQSSAKLRPTPVLQSSAKLRPTPVLQSSAKLRPNPVLQSSAKLRPSPVLQSSAKLRPTPVLQSSAKLRPSPVLQSSAKLRPTPVLQSSAKLRPTPVLQSSAKLRPNPVLQSSAKLRPSPVLQSSAKLRPTPVLQSSAKLRPTPVLQSSAKLRPNPVLQSSVNVLMNNTKKRYEVRHSYMIAKVKPFDLGQEGVEIVLYFLSEDDLEKLLVADGELCQALLCLNYPRSWPHEPSLSARPTIGCQDMQNVNVEDERQNVDYQKDDYEDNLNPDSSTTQDPGCTSSSIFHSLSQLTRSPTSCLRLLVTPPTLTRSLPPHLHHTKPSAPDEPSDSSDEEISKETASPHHQFNSYTVLLTPHGGLLTRLQRQHGQINMQQDPVEEETEDP